MPEQAKVIENGIEVDVIEPSFNSEPVIECDTEALATESEDSNTTTSLYGFEFRDVDNRRLPEGVERQANIKQLWQRSHEILGLALQGMKNSEIAELLNITPVTVSNTLNSDLGKQKLARMREGRDEEYVQINEKVKELTHKALDIYNEIFTSPSVDAKLKKETADTVTLDIAGMRAPTKIDTRSSSLHATVSEVEEFKRRGLAAAKESGMLAVVEGEGQGKSIEV